jgi:hypothetical protein
MVNENGCSQEGIDVMGSEPASIWAAKNPEYR